MLKNKVTAIVLSIMMVITVLLPTSLGFATGSFSLKIGTGRAKRNATAVVSVSTVSTGSITGIEVITDYSQGVGNGYISLQNAELGSGLTALELGNEDVNDNYTSAANSIQTYVGASNANEKVIPANAELLKLTFSISNTAKGIIPINFLSNDGAIINDENGEEYTPDLVNGNIVVLPESISVSAPTKAEYYEGETLDLTGMVVTL